MPAERKNGMLSVRLPKALISRVDFLARNTDGDLKNRSTVVRAALDDWLPERERDLEQNLEKLGAPSKKAPR